MAFKSEDVLQEFAEAAALGREYQGDGAHLLPAVDFERRRRGALLAMRRRVTPEYVAAAVGSYFGVDAARLRGRSQVAEVASARRVAMYLHRRIFKASWTEVGQFYDRNHTLACRQLTEAEMVDVSRVLSAMQEEILSQPEPQRRRLPAERDSVTKKFKIGGVKGYVTASPFEDGTPGEIFITIDKAGSTLRGFCDSFAIAVSLGLQRGVPLEDFAHKFLNTRFSPSGFTGEGEDGIASASSVLDYVFRWLTKRFPTKAQADVAPVAAASPTHQVEADAPTCAECGTAMVRSGSCYKCGNCGATSGCS